MLKNKIVKIVIITFSLTFISSCSCSKEETLYSPSEMWSMASKVDSTIELVAIPNHEEHLRILCVHYHTEGCIEGSGKRIKVRKVQLPVIQFEKEHQACVAAKKINQWFAGNWLFDQVSGEPVLESFVQEAFQAQKATDDFVCP